MKMFKGFRWRVVGSWAVVVSFVAVLLEVSMGFAAEKTEAGSEFKMRIRNRVEVIASTEGLTPADTYGRWNALNLNFFRQAREDTLVFAQLTGHARKEGNGLQANVGVVKDWSKTFFTNTAIGSGTNSTYLPRIAIDHDFNFKFGKNGQTVWSLGTAYFQYYDGHQDWIMKTGFTAYRDKWVYDYHLFRNMSNPGAVESFSHKFSVAYGVPKRYWTTLTYSFGKQAYLASSLAIPEAVQNYSQFIGLNYRRWLGPHHGIIGEVNYLKLFDAYNKLGFSLGFFSEY